MTVLVTGSSGHLGEALVRTLQAQRRKVIGIDIRPVLSRTGWARLPTAALSAIA